MRAVLRMSAATVMLVALAGCTTAAPEPSPQTSTAPSATTPAAPPPSTGPFGEDGDEAAWAIAQHSDLDPD